MNEIDKGNSSHPEHTEVKSEHFMTPERYKQIFNQDYVRIIPTTTIVMENNQPVITSVRREIGSDEWRKIFNEDVQIPVMVPKVEKLSWIKRGKVDSTHLMIDVPIARTAIDIDDYADGIHIDPTEAIDDEDGYTYYSFLPVTQQRRYIAGQWQDIKIPNPYGTVVLRWERKDEVNVQHTIYNVEHF